MTTLVDDTPLGRLRALRAEDYPAAAGLLRDLADRADAAEHAEGADDLARAGRLLARLDADEVMAHHPDTDQISVAITGSSTLAGLVAPLTAELARHGMLLRPTISDYDAWLRDLQDPSSGVYGTDLALCVLDASVVFAAVPLPWRVDDARQATIGLLAQLDQLAAGYTANGSGTLVLNTLPLLRTHTHQLVDAVSRAELGAVWREFNAGLLRLAARHERVITIDLDPLIAATGPVQDTRLATYAKAELGDELLAGYAREVGHLARAVRGRTKKVLVLDADNTLWDGILGDDGADGIAAASTYRGEAFGAFQRVAKQLGSQGVLLAVSSKNDQEPVLDVLRNHPDMVLREDDFVRINANWQPKDGNLAEIAHRLNLGVDSFVFADDSPFERGMVAASLPAVAIVALDDEPAEHVSRLLADGWFDVRALTAADAERAATYKTDAARADLLEATGSTEEYLRQLDVRLSVSPVAQHEITRLAQLTLRTNQFNLTTERLQIEDVRELAIDPDHYVLAIRSADRFADNGVIGGLFAHRDGTALHLDNAILSCRVFARGIEQSAVAALLAHAKATGLTTAYARYRPTKKNANVRDFWPSMGFVRDGGTDDAPDFRHDLAEVPPVPDHVTLDASFRSES
ncbi:MAG TPA: HAD-IIIC family phosphatase [Jatrophihabitantaceae bacterium]